ncbi:uncharacterized protein TNCV_4454371 [Trichonephila clavipes]|nr:uncharacterized protein TNCV_4454371 [Trichonephila clavipes]
MKPENAVNGFKGLGLYPLNRKAIQHRIFITDKGNCEGPLGPHFENENKLESYKNHLSVKTISAIENSKRKRKKLQSKTGEVLTTENVWERLAAEESNRKNKFHQVNIKKDVKDTESFKVKQGPWVERLSTGQEVNHLNSLDK